MNRTIAAATLALVLVGCSSTDEPEATPDKPSTTVEATTESTEAPTTAPTTEATTTTAAPTTVTTTTAPATTTAPPEPTPGCTPADQADIDAITAGLTGGATRIAEAYQVTGADGIRYIGANIYDAAGDKLSSADVWAFDGTDAYSLSGSARNDYSTRLPDGRDLGGDLGISAGDEYGTQAQDCATG